MNFYQSDFTLENYIQLIELVKEKNYNFISFNEIQNYSSNKYCLWRHDIDFSVKDAVKLARIEKDLSISSTYFVQLSSNFYNVFDPEILKQLKKVIEYGHNIGLHFYPQLYNPKNKHKLTQRLKFEKEILEALIERSIDCFSYHNPSNEYLSYDNSEYSGMINTYSKFIKNNISYCSDSNGYWRHKRLKDFINEDNQKIQVLTHPIWWQEDLVTPRNKIINKIASISNDLLQWYDATLEISGRKNF